MKLKMNDRLIRRLLLTYSLTFILISIADASAMLADELVVARFLGTDAMAAVGLSSPTFAIFTLFGGVFAVGTQSLCSAALSGADAKKHQKIFSSSIMMSGIIVILVTCTCFLFVRQLCIIYGADPADSKMFGLLEGYLKGNFIGIPGYIFFLILSPLVILDNNKKSITIATLLQNIINVVGDLLAAAVFGAGIEGIGIVTGISWDIAVIVLVLNFFKKNSIFQFKLQKIDFRSIGKIIVTGSPRISRYLCKILSKLFTNRIILLYGGSVSVSALSVNHSLTGFLLVVGLGISESVKTYTQIIYSEKDKPSILLLMRNAFRLALLMTIPLAFVVTVLARPIATLFVVEQTEVLHLTVIAITCLAISIPFNAVNCILIDYLQGARKIGLANILSFLHRLICYASLSLLLGYLLGRSGVFIAIPVSEVVVTIIYVVIVLIKNKPKSALKEKLLDIPADFDSGILGSCSVSIENMDDVLTLSEQIGDFLKQYDNYSKRVINAVALCLEEIAGNIVEHGFKLDRKPHHCDIRIIIEQDHTICLRIRDDCKLFDMQEIYKALKKEDIAANVGIKIVYGMARNVSYFSLLKTNNIIIHI